MNPTTHKFERLDLLGFKNCGFQLYEHKQFRPGKGDSKYSDIYTLRYFGNMECLKFPEFDHWPFTFEKCLGVACQFKNRKRMGFV